MNYNRNANPGAIDMTELQAIIDQHEGITSQEISQIIFGDTTTAHVTSVLHCCTKGIDNGELDIVKRRANASMYVMWYPSRFRGVPMTELECLMSQKEDFTLRSLTTEYHHLDSRRRMQGKLESYFDAMLTDGTIMKVGETKSGRPRYAWNWYVKPA